MRSAMDHYLFCQLSENNMNPIKNCNARLQMLALSNFANKSGFSLVYTDDDTFFRSKVDSNSKYSFNKFVHIYNTTSSSVKLIDRADMAVIRIYLGLENNEIIVKRGKTLKFADKTGEIVMNTFMNQSILRALIESAEYYFTLNAREV